MTKFFLKVPSGNLLRSLLIAVLILLVADLTGSTSAEIISTPPIMEITFQDGLISVDLVDAPLIDVLQRIKEEFGFKAHFHGDLTELITLSFTDIPLDKCLRQLTANHSLSVASLPTTQPSEQNEAKQIAEVWVLSRSSTSKTLNVTPVLPVIPSPDYSDDTDKASEDTPEQLDNEEPESVPLDQLLNDPDAEKSSQRQAIKKLAEIGGSASVMAMAEFLSNEEDKELRQLLVNEISSVQNEESTQVLGQVIQSESDPEIRKIAIRALGQRQNDNAARALLEEALNDTDEEVKALADQLLTQ